MMKSFAIQYMSIHNKLFSFAVPVFFLAFLLGGMFAFDQYRSLPENSYMGELSLSGQNRSEALQTVMEVVDELRHMSVEIVIDDSLSKAFSMEELGINYDEYRTVRKIFDETNWIVRFFTQRSRAQENNISTFRPVININHNLLNKTLEGYLYSAERDFVNAGIVWAGNIWLSRDAIPGLILKEGDFEKIKQEVVEAAFPYQSGIVLAANYESVEANIHSEDFAVLLEKINLVSSSPVTLVYEEENLEIKLSENENWFEIDELAQTVALNEKFAKDWIREYVSAKNRDKGRLTITAVNELISEYDKKPYKKADYQGSLEKGRALDHQKILDSFRAFVADPTIERKIVVEWEVFEPEIVSEVPGYEFPQILSTGTSSYYYGSYFNRVKNIKLSLDTFNGVIVEPGEELSFNRITGWIVRRKGYTETEIINEGKVEKGVGGGVCQTSTTVYRAILNAGMKVTERRNHTLDVIYYHKDGYGLDATVYTESGSDLKWVNDTPGPMIIFTSTIDDEYEARVEFFGTSDERRVVLTNIPTGNSLYKRWDQKIIWPNHTETRVIKSIYQLPRKDEEALEGEI